MQFKEYNQYETTGDEKKYTLYRVFIGIFLIIIISCIGSYTIWTNNSTHKNKQELIPKETNTNTEKPMQYSKNSPNIIQINSTNISIQETITPILNNLEKSSISPQDMYEFILVDTNKKAVPFSVFAKSVNITISTELLRTLNDTFSIFIYKDEANLRIGASINILKIDTIEAVLKNQESTLATALAPLFLDNNIKIENGSFSSSIYNGSNIRYLAIDKQNNFSIDYATINSKLLIGTSKDTLRSMITKAKNSQSPIATISTPTQNQDETTSEIKIDDMKGAYETYTKAKDEIELVQNVSDLKRVIEKYGSKNIKEKLKKLPLSDDMSANIIFTSEPPANASRVTALITIKISTQSLKGSVTMIIEDNEWKADFVI